MQCCGETDINTLKDIEKNLYKNFRKVKFFKIFIPSFGERWVFASAIL